MTEITRDEEIKTIWRNPDTRLIYKVLLGVLLLGVGVVVGRLIYATPEAALAWGYGLNLFTGLISTLATVLILDQLAERRADRKAEDTRKQQLIDDAASQVNDVAKNAVYQMRRKGWLEGEDGLLKGADLSKANLHEADLHAANLQGVDLGWANLHGIDLVFANLQGTSLLAANLQGADLTRANLHGARLLGANLHGAVLWGANLHEAILHEANLNGVNLVETEFDEQTILPDGSHWTAETEMQRFTDPEHPAFWRSDKDWSPAYRGKDET